MQVTIRRLTSAALLLVPLVLAGCASVVDGKPDANGGSGGGSTSGGSVPVATTGKQLAEQEAAAMRTVTSANLTMSITVNGMSIKATGAEQLENGRLVAADIRERVPSVGLMRILVSGGKIYVKIPGLAGSTGKPWALVRADSSNPLIRTLASSLQSSLSSASTQNMVAYSQAISSLTVVGKATVGGKSATKYSAIISVADLPASVQGKQTMLQSGITHLPVTMWVDSAGRPVQFDESLSLNGATTTTSVSIVDYNKPVTITPPPASQVSTS